MVGTLLLRGMLIGIVAGLLCFGFLKIVGEPQVDRAIAFETQLDEAKAQAAAQALIAKGLPAPKEEPEPELVSRRVQAGIGLFTGVMVYNVAFGGLFALAFALAYGRMGDFGPRAASALLAVLGLDRRLYRPKPQISGEPALGRRSGDDRHAHGAVFQHDRDLARGDDRGGDAAPPAARPLWRAGTHS